MGLKHHFFKVIRLSNTVLWLKKQTFHGVSVDACTTCLQHQKATDQAIDQHSLLATYALHLQQHSPARNLLKL